MSALLEENPAYQAVTVMKIEWGVYSGEPLVKEHNVTGRATLIMLKGDVEIGRVRWQNSRSQIEPLFQAVI